MVYVVSSVTGAIHNNQGCGKIAYRVVGPVYEPTGLSERLEK